MGWQSRGGRCGPSQLWDSIVRFSAVTVETRVQVQQRESSHSQIARIFLNSFIEWRLPFILPPSPVRVAGILSQSHIIIPRSPHATACQWSPRSVDCQPSHMKSYMQRFNTFSWPQPLFPWIPCSVFLIRCFCTGQGAKKVAHSAAAFPESLSSLLNCKCKQWGQVKVWQGCHLDLKKKKNCCFPTKHILLLPHFL